MHAANDPVVTSGSVRLDDIAANPWCEHPLAGSGSASPQDHHTSNRLSAFSAISDCLLCSGFSGIGRLLHAMVPAGGHSMDWPTGGLTGCVGGALLPADGLNRSTLTPSGSDMHSLSCGVLLHCPCGPGRTNPFQ